MPAVIQAKHAPLIQKGNGMSYDPKTFAKDHKVKNFLEIDDPQQILDMFKPLEFEGHRA